MPLFVLFIAVVSILALFVYQNWSPSLALAFLGNSTSPLPLSLWMLGAFMLGALTTIVMAGLLRIAGSQQFSSEDESDDPLRRSVGTRRYDRDEVDDGDNWIEDLDETDRQVASQRSVDSDDEDDRAATIPPYDQDQIVDSVRSTVGQPRDYERQQQPQRATQDGSSYAYSYRESAKSRAGRTEAVYDADYRVLVPPYKPTAPEEAEPWPEDDIQLPEPEDEEEVWDVSEGDDWAVDRRRNNDWAKD